MNISNLFHICAKKSIGKLSFKRIIVVINPRQISVALIVQVTGKYIKGKIFLNHIVFWLFIGDNDLPRLILKLSLNLIFTFYSKFYKLHRHLGFLHKLLVVNKIFYYFFGFKFGFIFILFNGNPRGQITSELIEKAL